MKKNIQKESFPGDKGNQIPIVISYLVIRNAIGILGILLPLVLVFGSFLFGHVKEILPSISNYYHTNMRDFFVGLLCAVALFLFAYKGYDKRDNITGNLGCIFALGVAFFPTSTGDTLSTRPPVIGILHLAFATLFFLVLIYFSLVLFTKTGKKVMTRRKRIENRVFRLCGYIMLACILLIALYFSVLENVIPGLAYCDPVFWLESFCLLAFGISWLTKGKLLRNNV